MRSFLKIILTAALFLLISSCAVHGLYYLGFHGPTIKLYPDTHGEVTEDEDCLACHAPEEDPEGPTTSHPGFHGCIKCHNDDIH